jgi:hypothetical protein
MWVIDDEIGKEVGINGDGFDYLLEKMGQNNQEIKIN